YKCKFFAAMGLRVLHMEFLKPPRKRTQPYRSKARTMTMAGLKFHRKTAHCSTLLDLSINF
ncbi:MAG: hypothetical protein FWE24_03900, partial [Defluviitaleaceae bacterium]|nr:hypothetical protein [Defluviitaleaceae bacterium]